MKNLVNTLLILIIFSIFTCYANIKSSSSHIEIPKVSQEISMNIDSTYIIIDSLKASLYNEVSQYIKTYHKTCPDIIPESIIKYGLMHNIDICFMMSQAKIETVFGKAGIGRATSKKSIFGVMSKKYKTYDDAISHYVNVLNKYYLSETRTEQDLLQKFTTKTGVRYAANPNYEKDLRSTYKNICNTTLIKELQDQILFLMNQLDDTLYANNQ